MKPSLTLLVAMLVAGGALASEVFKTTDSKGQPVYTDRPATLPAERLDVRTQTTDKVEVQQRYDEQMKTYAASEKAQTVQAADAADAAIASMNGFQIGTKRLKVQHKRIHQRSDYIGGGSSSSLVDHDDELASIEYHHQVIHGLDDGLHSHSDDSDATSPSGAAEDNNGVDTSLDGAVQNLRIDA